MPLDRAALLGCAVHTGIGAVRHSANVSLGETVAVVPNHTCTAVNLVPELLVIDNNHVADHWPVAARAANR